MVAAKPNPPNLAFQVRDFEIGEDITRVLLA